MEGNFGVLINFKGDKDFGVDTGYKVDNDKDFYADVEKQKEKFLRDIKEQHEQELFEKLNVPQEHTKEELIALMLYKGKNIKAHIHPSIFFEVAEMLKETDNN